MKKRRVRIKARKPRDYYIDYQMVDLGDGTKPFKATQNGLIVATDVVLMSCYRVLQLNAKDCRKLAAWLLKAADWLDAKKEGE